MLHDTEPIWIIEAGVFGRNSERLRTEVDQQGMECYVVSQHTLSDNLELLRGGRPVLQDDCVISYSSFPFAYAVKQKGWNPGSWSDVDNLACTTYYAYFGRYLLNQHYAILSGVEAVRQSDFWFDVFGRNEQLFARPDSVEKLFTGRCVNKEGFAAALAPARYNPATLVVIAPPQTIGREWRLVVAENSVVAASQYMVDGKLNVARGCPDEVTACAEEILQNVSWRPDPIFMMDVCETNGRLRLLELNSFSCSGLYECDLAAVVTAASQVARQAVTSILKPLA